MKMESQPGVAGFVGKVKPRVVSHILRLLKAPIPAFAPFFSVAPMSAVARALVGTSS